MPASKQAFTEYKEAALGTWDFCTALGGTTTLDHAIQCMKVCAKPLRLVVFWGKRDAVGRGDMNAKTLLSHSELLRTSVTAAFGSE